MSDPVPYLELPRPSSTSRIPDLCELARWPTHPWMTRPLTKRLWATTYAPLGATQSRSGLAHRHAVVLLWHPFVGMALHRARRSEAFRHAHHKWDGFADFRGQGRFGRVACKTPLDGCSGINQLIERFAWLTPGMSGAVDALGRRVQGNVKRRVAGWEKGWTWLSEEEREAWKRDRRAGSYAYVEGNPEVLGLPGEPLEELACDRVSPVIPRG